MKVNNKDYQTVWMEGNEVKLIEQTKLPYKFEIYSCKSYNETASAIKTMIVRGAGAIGATGAYGLVQAALEANNENFKEYIEKAAETLRSTRPTAQNLFTGINYVYDAIKNISDLKQMQETAVSKAKEFADYDANACKKIGEHGNSLIKDNYKIETHCNAGWLAFVDWGSALSPIYYAHRSGKKVFVYVDETRPRNQGSFLTAWELGQENVPHAIIADNAAGFYMKNKEIDIMIVGADRIAANGDVANKIGTYEKAVLAKENNVPFYVAAPTTTFDLNTEDGNKIPIEERDQDEVLFINGIDENKNVVKVRIASEKSDAKNPAFDVTPAKYIAGIITEKGIVKANKEEIKKLIG
ncbi:MAG: S-methyl-5-thioribose-1-phosphate isomerase [Candidatus Woesearchaeota archaeon]|jgi:S-methyl-5-thioribose-1-phosphate isomerase|nr:S-methyl-5-thioribose-1-phosphate isomerase [Candidatus Woesearchaeota archaeon]MDP7622889.1 S-methyl-5-thioribose-1-phosphate isomerase [Candidatus Woesearchaeota archaeon]HJN57092.1 S-methyl-5-thioribose-1-phosphate isomerase [Candidatus Woesearchaeota archaeon]|tara:strand:- start:2875 stop:3936 length:1062 start_codon:yes stop_codon:yes gene_type:complete